MGGVGSGPLKLPKHLRAVPDAPSAGTIAETVARRAPDKPPGFPDDPELAKLWEELVPVLDEPGLLSPGDGPTIELALRHFLAARRACDALFAGEVVIPDREHGSAKKNPAGAEFRAQSALFLEFAKQLGMTFVSRARTPAAKSSEPAAEANPFAAPRASAAQ